MSSLYYKTLHQWGLSSIPFMSVPPEDMGTLARIFYGRKEELAIALPTLSEGRNVLVRGIWGVGKTAFIRYVLYCLQKEWEQLGQQSLVLYIARFPGEDSEALYGAILFALAKFLADKVRMAKRLWERLRGLQMTRSHQVQIEGTVKLPLVSLDASWGREQEVSWEVQNVYPTLLDLLNEAQKRYKRVIIAIDDLDKKTPRAVLDILNDATDLLRQGQGQRGFLLTGRYISTVEDISHQMLGLFSETITLSRMSTDDLRHIAINYLNTVRKQQSEELAPFTPGVIDQIAEYAYHIPRQFNLICEKVMRRAASEGVAWIDEEIFPRLWHQAQKSFFNSLEITPEIRRLLYVAQQQGGLQVDVDDATLEKLGVDTFVELLPQLRRLEGDLLIKLEDGRWVTSMLLPDEGHEA